MDKLKNKDTFFIGLMLFALFFGAGNLIFPPFLGQQAGTNFWPAMFGFIVTGVGLPILAVIAIANAKGGIEGIAKGVHPLFELFFTVTVYLSIGPFFAIPRGANVAYEMGVKPFLENSGTGIALFVFSLGFFALVYWVSLNPSKLVDRIGTILTPLLLGTIAVLVAVGIFRLDEPFGMPIKKYESSAFTAGFLEGYLTMDTIAALAFGIVVIQSIRVRNVVEPKMVARAAGKAGIIAGIGLAAVYVGIGLIGARLPGAEGFENGGELLTAASRFLLGGSGVLLLGVIVMLACFTTCVGLVTATSQYFNKLLPKISYKKFATVITIVSFSISNLGLNQIISISVPVLIIIYPLTIVLVVLALLKRFVGQARGIYIGAVTATAFPSIYDGLKTFGFESASISRLFETLPMYEQGLGWFIPAMIGALLGALADKLAAKKADKKIVVNE